MAAASLLDAVVIRGLEPNKRFRFTVHWTAPACRRRLARPYQPSRGVCRTAAATAHRGFPIVAIRVVVIGTAVHRSRMNGRSPRVIRTRRPAGQTCSYSAATRASSSALVLVAIPGERTEPARPSAIAQARCRRSHAIRSAAEPRWPWSRLLHHRLASAGIPRRSKSGRGRLAPAAQYVL